MAEPTYSAIASQYNKAVASATTMTGLGFTSSQIDKCEACDITVATASVNYTVDGTAPSATNGLAIQTANPPLRLYGREMIRQLQFFSGTGVVNITLLGRI